MGNFIFGHSAEKDNKFVDYTGLPRHLSMLYGKVQI